MIRTKPHDNNLFSIRLESFLNSYFCDRLGTCSNYFPETEAFPILCLTHTLTHTVSANLTGSPSSSSSILKSLTLFNILCGFVFHFHPKMLPGLLSASNRLFFFASDSSICSLLYLQTIFQLMTFRMFFKGFR